MGSVFSEPAPVLVPGECWWLLQGSLWRVAGVFGRDASLLVIDAHLSGYSVDPPKLLVEEVLHLALHTAVGLPVS